MNRVKLDRASSAVKRFVRSLPIEPEGVELELNGRVLCRVTSAKLLTDSEKRNLFERVKKQSRRAHLRNRNVPAQVVEREVREAIKQVRSSRKP